MAGFSLSKTSYIKGLQCLKYLYLYKHHYKLRDRLSAEKLAKFKRGTDMGILAQQLFPGGIDLKPRSHYHYEKAVALTAQHISLKTPVIYEASFKYNDVLVFLDILVYENERWHAYEVKSSLNISSTFLNDAALQFYVIKGAGIPLVDMSLVYMDSAYVKEGAIDVAALFKAQSVKNEVLEMQPFVEAQIKLQKSTLLQKQIPDVAVGTHCQQPYECDFTGFCWNKLKNVETILNIDFIDIDKRFEWVEKGFDTIDKLMDNPQLDDFTLKRLQTLFSKKDSFDNIILSQFLHVLKQNTCYLDVQLFNPALPLLNNSSPYDVFPFCCTYAPSKDINKCHTYVFRNGQSDHRPFLDFIRHMLDKFEYVVVYDKAAFIDMMKTLKAAKDTLLFDDGFSERICGLKDFFTTGAYVSSKLVSNFEFFDVLHELKLKNPFSKKPIANIYDAAEAFMNLYEKPVSLFALPEEENITDFGKSNIYYMDKLAGNITKYV